jgi:hypothetical protein
MDASYGYFLLTKFYPEDEIKETKMGGACRTCGREKKCYSFWVELRHCATSRKVAGSIPDGVIGIFH